MSCWDSTFIGLTSSLIPGMQTWHSLFLLLYHLKQFLYHTPLYIILYYYVSCILCYYIILKWHLNCKSNNYSIPLHAMCLQGKFGSWVPSVPNTDTTWKGMETYSSPFAIREGLLVPLHNHANCSITPVLQRQGGWTRTTENAVHQPWLPVAE